MERNANPELCADLDPCLATGRQAYVAGFLLDEVGRVVLVRKLRPAWQAGSLNGVGGKVEPGESPSRAMRREFGEEAGLDLGGWEHVASVTFPAGVVWFFRLFVAAGVVDRVRACTDEPIEVWDVAEVLLAGVPVLPNLRWLLPFATYRHDRYAPVVAHEANTAG